MIPWRRIAWFGLVALLGAGALRAVNAVPPLLTTAATTTVDSGGRPWAYLAFGENQPGLIAGRRLAVYFKAGAPSSTNQFVARGPVTGSADPGVLQVMLSRAAKIGDNLGALEAQLIALHGWLLNSHNSVASGTNQPPALPLNQRLAALLARASGDGPLTQMLNLYGLAHPAIRLGLGTAWAGPLDVPTGSPVTLEVREQDASGRDLSVIGRVTLLAGQPETLLSPGPVVVVPDASSAGDLNIKLRWATPDALRHAGTRHHGDLAWRVGRAFAESHGFDQAPPAGSALDALTLSNPGDVKRVGGPIFPSKLFEPADVADFVADPSTSFLSDNNDRYAASGVPLAEGDQYYYFVAAADALGRPGPAAPGVLATVCRRVPPPVPSRVTMLHPWSPVAGQSLEVSWLANTPGVGVRTTRYEVFRGDDLTQLAAAQRGELDLTAVPVVPGQPTAVIRLASVDDPGVTPAVTLRYDDDGGGMTNKTWWYAVRAVHQSPPGCGDLFSPLSPPVFAALQDRTAPSAPGTNDFVPPTLGCLRLGCINDIPSGYEVTTNQLNTNFANYIARCDRRPGVVAAHFQVIDTADGSVSLPETTVVFAEGDVTADITWTLPFLAYFDTLDVQCAVEAADGTLSLWAHASMTGILPFGGNRATAHFLGGAIENSEVAAAAPGDALWTSILNQPATPCAGDVHLTVSPVTGRVVHPRFCIPLAERTEQYRVYRRVADGPLTLIGQGLQKYSGPGCAFTFEDPAPPTSNGAVYYFLQCLDEQGRPSAMRSLGQIQFTGDTPPTPVLLAPQPADFGGTLAAATLNLIWVCPPEHVERFEIFVKSTKPASDPDQGIAAVPGAFFRVTPVRFGSPKVFKGIPIEESLLRPPQPLTVQQSLLTGRVGGDFSAGPRFTLPLKVDPSLSYTVWIRALGPHGEAGAISRTISFQWQAPVPPPADIAWPARPLPPVASFNAGIQVVDFSAFTPAQLLWGPAFNGGEPSVNPDETPIGIRVGSLPLGVNPPGIAYVTGNVTGPALIALSSSSVYGRLDPNSHVYTRDGDASQSLLPCVLYRQQVANPLFPMVSGDVIQCSPLLFSIAYAYAASGREEEAVLIDPLFRWMPPNGANAANGAVDLYLVDTQPVVAGAAYRYWLVRFNSLGEPVQTVPCGVVTVRTP